MSTLFITDERMLKHQCEWDKTHIERPERLKWILDKLRKSDLLDKCTKLESRFSTIDELATIHSKEHIERIQQTEDMSLEEQETLCSEYEDIYINNYSWESALLSAGCALALTEKVLQTVGSNGFAVIRPPGHHSSQDKACGFCLFNNIALCAKKAISMGLRRVLIVDWDVHAGQGTQYSIKDDHRIQLVSIHRYEEGAFWPQLQESAIVNEYSNTMNVPLNAIQLNDNDYISIMSTLVLPLIHNWKPELILVSCGFDAAVGDPEGEMQVTPLGFGTLTGLLSAQDIPLVLLLEGGYFLESIGECSTHVLKALIDRAPPKMYIENIGPSDELLNTLVYALHTYRPMIGFDFAECVNMIRKRQKLPIISNFDKHEYKGERELSFPYETRNLYTPRETEVEEEFAKKLHEMIIQRQETERKTIKLSFGKNKKSIELSFDEKSFKLHAEKFVDALFIYHFILIPLTIKYEFQVDSTYSLYNFAQFTSHLAVSPSSNELLSDKLVGEIVHLTEDFGFWR